MAVQGRTGEPVGILRLTARELAHLLDTLSFFVGWLWPLWDRADEPSPTFSFAPRCAVWRGPRAISTASSAVS